MLQVRLTWLSVSKIVLQFGWRSTWGIWGSHVLDTGEVTAIGGVFQYVTPSGEMDPQATYYTTNMRHSFSGSNFEPRFLQRYFDNAFAFPAPGQNLVSRLVIKDMLRRA